jgi:hypothetical protein
MSLDKLAVSNAALIKIGAKRLSSFPVGTETSPEAKAVYASYDIVRDECLTEFMWTFAQKRAALIDMTRTDQDDWATATAYVVDDIVYDPTLAKYYKCLIAHTSVALFATDLAAAKWELYTDWVTATVYAKGDKVYNAGVEYSCLTNHTAGTFATDLTAVKWIATELLAMDDDDVSVIYYRPTDFLKLNFVSDQDALIKLEGSRILSDTEDLKILYTYKNDDPSTYFPQFVTALETRLAAEICFNLVESANKAQALFTEYEKIRLPRAMSADSQQGTPMEARQDDWENARFGAGNKIKPNSQTWHPWN